MRTHKIICRMFSENDALCKQLDELSKEGFFVVAMSESLSAVGNGPGNGSWSVLLAKEEGSYR